MQFDLLRYHQVLRYYSVGIVNTIVGYGLYAALVSFWGNVYFAQIISHICGALFNFYMFKWHVFRGARPSTPRYILSYAGNYVLSVSMLFIVSHFVQSKYLLGLVCILATSAFNYFILKRFVFRRDV